MCVILISIRRANRDVNNFELAFLAVVGIGYILWNIVNVELRHFPAKESSVLTAQDMLCLAVRATIDRGVGTTDRVNCTNFPAIIKFLDAVEEKFLGTKVSVRRATVPEQFQAIVRG